MLKTPTHLEGWFSLYPSLGALSAFLEGANIKTEKTRNQLTSEISSAVSTVGIPSSSLLVTCSFIDKYVLQRGNQRILSPDLKNAAALHPPVALSRPEKVKVNTECAEQLKLTWSQKVGSAWIPLLVPWSFPQQWLSLSLPRCLQG